MSALFVNERRMNTRAAEFVTNRLGPDVCPPGLPAPARPTTQPGVSRAASVTAALLLSLVLSSAGSAQTAAPPAPARQTTAVAITILIDQTVALFPRLNGDVVEVQGTTATVSIDRKAGAQPGVVLETFREGREIRHPQTGALLGQSVDLLGRAVITRVFDGYSQVIVEGAPVQPGDRVRTSTNAVKLTLLPLKGPGVRDPLIEAATMEVYEGFKRAGGFQLGAGDQIAAWLSQEGISGEDLLKGRGVQQALQRFQADNVLVLYYTMVERQPFVEARLFTASRADAALSTAFFVPADIKPAPREQFSSDDRKPPVRERRQSLLARLLGIDADRASYSGGEGALALTEVARMAFATVAMDVSVAPADRIPRVALSDGERVYVYRIVRRALDPEWTFATRGIGSIISVQLADITGDGTLSVVANRFDSRVGMNSFIAATRNGKPIILVDNIDTILYAVDDTGAGVKQTLWSQRYREDTFFSKGQVDKVVLRKGSLVRERAASVPENFRATGATFSNIAGTDSRSLAYIDDQSRLRIIAGNTEVWRSSTTVGGGGPRVEVARYLQKGGSRSAFFEFEPTPLGVDLDGDGVQEIIVPQNKGENGAIAVVYRSAAGIRFQQVKSGFEGLIGGFGAVHSEDGGTPTLVIAVVRPASLLRRKGDTQIIMTSGE